MKPLFRLSIIAPLFLVMAPTAFSGQDSKEIPVQQQQKPVAEDEWRFSFTPYFWLPSIVGTVSTPEINVAGRTIGGDFSVDQTWWDTLSKFSSNFYVLALDGRFEAWKGRWGGFLDGYWIFGKTTSSNSDSRLIFRDRVDITATSSVTSKFDLGQFNFGPQFVLAKAAIGTDSTMSLITYGGGRVNWAGQDLDGTITIRASANIGEIGQTFHFSNDQGRAFVEPMIGLKSTWSLGPNWVVMVRGDVAGFGWVEGNNWDCDLEAGVGWQVHRNVLLDLAYRARGQWQDLGANDEVRVRAWYHGPELGITFRF